MTIDLLLSRMSKRTIDKSQHLRRYFFVRLAKVLYPTLSSLSYLGTATIVVLLGINGHFGVANSR